jgi:hypothetical protein
VVCDFVRKASLLYEAARVVDNTCDTRASFDCDEHQSFLLRWVESSYGLGKCKNGAVTKFWGAVQLLQKCVCEQLDRVGCDCDRMHCALKVKSMEDYLANGIKTALMNLMRSRLGVVKGLKESDFCVCFLGLLAKGTPSLELDVEFMILCKEDKIGLCRLLSLLLSIDIIRLGESQIPESWWVSISTI